MTESLTDMGYCLDCEYSLRGLPQPICPECGRAFVPGDPTTFKLKERPRLSWRRYAREPQMWHVTSATVVTVAYLCSSTEPGGCAAAFGVGITMAGVLCALTLIVDYAVRAVAMIADRRRASLDKAKLRRRHWWRWVITPTCLGLGISAAASAWPMRIRFQFSRRAFDEAARSVQNGKDPKTLPGKMGSYRVKRVRQWEGSIFFHTGYSGWDSVGFVYRADGKKVKHGHIRLAPHWFADVD